MGMSKLVNSLSVRGRVNNRLTIESAVLNPHDFKTLLHKEESVTSTPPVSIHSSRRTLQNPKILADQLLVKDLEAYREALINLRSQGLSFQLNRKQ